MSIVQFPPAVSRGSSLNCPVTNGITSRIACRSKSVTHLASLYHICTGNSAYVPENQICKIGCSPGKAQIFAFRKKRSSKTSRCGILQQTTYYHKKKFLFFVNSIYFSYICQKTIMEAQDFLHPEVKKEIKTVCSKCKGTGVNSFGEGCDEC